MAKKIEDERKFLTWVVFIFMILALLLAGSDFANSQEGTPFSDSFHLGNIQELGTDPGSKIKNLEEDRKKALFLIEIFQERGLKEASKNQKKLIKLIERELEFLSRKQ